jgi:SHS2 domain-containing protein
MEPGYRFLEHTADTGIEVISPTLEGIYEIAGEALFTLIASPTQANLVPFRVESNGEEPEILLVNFLNDLLLHFEVDRLLFRKIKVHSLGNGQLVADASCEPLHPESHRVDTVVKAATYHSVSVERKGGKWHAVVYLDL